MLNNEELASRVAICFQELAAQTDGSGREFLVKLLHFMCRSLQPRNHRFNRERQPLMELRSQLEQDKLTR